MQSRRSSHGIRRAGLAVAGTLAVALATPGGAQFEKPYHIVDLAPGVFAVVWDEILEWPYEGNNLVIVNDEDVVVVDAKRTPSLAETVIREIRARTEKPVRYLVNTHWHADHTYANPVFRRAYPGLEIVGHPATVPAFSEILQRSIDRTLAFASTAEQQLASGRGDDGRELTAEERSALAARWERTRTELLPLFRTVELVPPTLLVSDRLTLRRGEREIEIRFLGEANTRGDLVVYLPRERILATGDLVVKPYPFLGLDDHPQSWVRVLDELESFDVAVLLPGHGEVERDFTYVRRVKALFAALVAQVESLHASGAGLDEAQRRVDLAAEIAGVVPDDEKLRDELAAEWVPYAVELAWKHLPAAHGGGSAGDGR